MAKNRGTSERKKFSAPLKALTQGNTSLARALERLLATAPEGSLRPLTALRPDEWIDLVYDHGTPDGSSITPADYADALVAGLKSLQRLQKLGATWDETAALLDAGFHSAADLLAAGPTTLAARLHGRIKPDRIRALYQRAKSPRKSRPTPSSST